jgi:hypothetical protein
VSRQQVADAVDTETGDVMVGAVLDADHEVVGNGGHPVQAQRRLVTGDAAVDLQRRAADRSLIRQRSRREAEDGTVASRQHTVRDRA